MQQEIIRVDADVVRRDTTDKVMRGATNVCINVTEGIVVFDFVEIARGEHKVWPLRSCSINAFIERYFITLDLSNDDDFMPCEPPKGSTYGDLKVGDAFFDPNGILRVVLGVDNNTFKDQLIGVHINTRNQPAVYVPVSVPVNIIPITDVFHRWIC